MGKLLNDKAGNPKNIVRPKTKWAIAEKWIEEQLQFLELLAIGVEMINEPKAIDAIKRQNERIYKAL